MGAAVYFKEFCVGKKSCFSAKQILSSGSQPKVRSVTRVCAKNGGKLGEFKHTFREIGMPRCIWSWKDISSMSFVLFLNEQAASPYCKWLKELILYFKIPARSIRIHIQLRLSCKNLMESSVCQQIKNKAYTKKKNQENKYFSSLCVDEYLNLNPYVHETERKQPEFILFGPTSRKHISNCRKPRRATVDHMQNSHSVLQLGRKRGYYMASL